MKFKNMKSFSLTIIIINIKTYTIIIIIIVIVYVFDTEINTGKLKHNCMYLKLNHNIKCRTPCIVKKKQTNYYHVNFPFTGSLVTEQFHKKDNSANLFAASLKTTSKRARSAEYSIKTNCWNGLGLANPKIVVNYG